MPIQAILVRSITEHHRQLLIRHLDCSEQVFDVTETTCSCHLPQATGQQCIHQRIVDAAGNPEPGTVFEFPLE